MPADELDPRYSLANERTFLAWVRTSLGLLAASVALVAVDLPWPAWLVDAIALGLALAAATSAVVSWARWREVERALAAGQVAPRPRGHAALAAVVALAAVCVAAMVVR